jgi:hypothetical protein
MSRRVTIAEQDAFQADTRLRLAATTGEPDPAELAREIHAEVIERCSQARGKRAVKNVLAILDELNREERNR